MTKRKNAASPLSRFRTGVVRKKPKKVDPKGGRYGTGLILGAVAITRGEALGHGQWVDVEMLDSVANALNQRGGWKVRFTHPDMSSDGLGKFLGRAYGGRRESDRVIIEEMHIAETARDTPDGDLGGYILRLAEEDPEAFGLSIVFYEDADAAYQFMDEHAGEDGVFASPDELNVDNLPHVRMESFRGVDFVDSPAANPDGLFHRETEMATQARELAEYALGLRAKPATSVAFGLDADRTRQFVARFLCERGLVITEKEAAMSDATQEQETTQVTDEQKYTTPVDVNPDETEEEVTSEPEQPIAASEGRRFMDSFGQQGAVWFAEGKTYEQCRDLWSKQLSDTNKALADRVEQLEKKLAAAAFSGGEVDGVSSSDESRSKDKKKSLLAGGGINIRNGRK